MFCSYCSYLLFTHDQIDAEGWKPFWPIWSYGTLMMPWQWTISPKWQFCPGHGKVLLLGARESGSWREMNSCLSWKLTAMNVPQTEMHSLKEVNSLLMKKMEALWWNHDPGASLDIDDCLHRHCLRSPDKWLCIISPLQWELLTTLLITSRGPSNVGAWCWKTMLWISSIHSSPLYS